MPEIPQHIRQERLAATTGNILLPQRQDRSLEGLGAAVTDVGVQFLRQAAKAEITDQVNTFQASSLTEVDEYMRTLGPNTDPDEFNEGLKKLLQARKNTLADMRNPRARDIANQWYIGQSIEWTDDAFWRSKKVGLQQMSNRLSLNVLQAENQMITGVTEADRKDAKTQRDQYLTNAVEDGLISTEERDVRIAKSDALVSKGLSDHQATIKQEAIRLESQVRPTLAEANEYIQTQGHIDGLDNAQITYLLTREKQRRDGLAATALDEYTEAILEGDFSPQLTQKIADDTRLNGYSAEIRSLERWMKSVGEGAKKRKPATPPERVTAEQAFLDALDDNDPKTAQDLLMKNSWMFTGAENSAFIKQLREPLDSVSDPTLKDALAEVEALADIERKAVSEFDVEGGVISKEERQRILTERTKILLRTNELKQAIRKWRTDNPNASPGQFNQAIDDILNPVKQEQAEDAVNKWWKIIRGPTIEPIDLGGGGIGGVGALGGVVQRDKTKPNVTFEAIIVNPGTGERRGWDGKKWVIIP